MKRRDSNKGKFINEKGKITWGNIIVRVIFALLFLVLIFYLYNRLVISNVEVNAFVEQLYDDLGFWGISLYVYLCDTFVLPLTPDVIFPLIADEWNIIQITFFIGTASVLGGLTGYWIGRLLSLIKFINRFTSKIGRSHHQLIKEKGAWAIALAALTPIPYSTVCWSAGILKVDFKKVVIASLVRYPRMLIYYYFFVAGFHIIGIL